MAEKKVAVVVVHGVADQQPSESARQIANLLTDLCPIGTYSTFQEEKIRIPLEPVEVPAAEPIRRSPFEERNLDAILRHRGKPPDVDPDHGFMRDQLRGYQSEDQPRIFETVRLDGVRNDTQCNVHVYEAYWADLSRLSKGILAFFGELYQLLLHLPSLGRNAVDYARAEDKGRLWPLFSWFHRWSIRWLTLFIVVLNLVLASLVLPILAPRLTRTPKPLPSAPTPFQRIEGCCGLPAVETLPNPPVQNLSVVDVVTKAILALALVGVTAALLRHRRPAAWIWTIAPLVAAGAGVFLAHRIALRWGGGRLLVFEAWGLSAALIWALLVKYESMRRGARLVGGIGLFGTFVALLEFLRDGDGTESSLTAAVMHVLEILNVALQIAWRIHVPWLLLTIVIGLFCAVTAGKGWKHRAWNTTWTARMTLTLSTALFANLTLAIWAALFKAVQQVLPPDKFQPRSMGPILDRLLCVNLAPVAPALWLKNTLMLSASRAFIYVTVTFALFVLAALWAIFPSILVETNPPRQHDEHARTNTRMRALGVWLTRGLNFIPAASEMFGLLLFGVVFLAWRQALTCTPPPESSWTAISAVAALLVALIGARFWLPGASAALDVILDVDNYLRQHPKANTPRARIAERCASLLRFILDPKRCGHDYSQVVIIAHSQGTIITADLLRFLRQPENPISAHLAERNPAFFTMGNPLRQLYARAFPGLYPWAWGGPHRQDLGVSEWMNAYCSGDYVGRILTGEFDEERWDRREDDPQDVATPMVISANGIDEMCIGEGAHTHYWDQHGRDIAEKLDELIAARCGGVSSSAV